MARADNGRDPPGQCGKNLWKPIATAGVASSAMTSTFSVMRPLPLALCALLLAGGCAKRVAPAKAPKPVRLLSQVAEKETEQFPDKREDIEIDTRDHDRTPRVVATGESPLLPTDGLMVKIYGDEEGLMGWDVDNLLLLEVLAENGKIVNRAAIGFSDLVMMGNERIDALGRQAFTFEPGEIILGTLVPEHGFYRLRATVLDYYGNGRCSDVWLHFSSSAGGGSADELRGQ